MLIISTSDPAWEHACEEAAKNGQPFRVQDTSSNHLPFFIKLSDQYGIVSRWDDREVEFHPELK